MSHGGHEKQGTGLRDVFDILVKAPPERLVSLTFQLSESPEDNVIHALCLLIRQREEQALSKLQTLRDHYLAKHLAERWKMSEGKLDDFAVCCGHFKEFTFESLVLLARIFKVLSEQRLCDPFLRNMAYVRALSRDDQKMGNSEDLAYDQLREEAKVVCGPQFSEWMCSSTELKSESCHDPQTSLDKGNTTLKVTLSQDESEKAHSLPSPLQASSSMPSYPTHLEISTPPTALFQDDKSTPMTSDASKSFLISEFEANNATGQSQTSEVPRLRSNIIGPIQTTRPTDEYNFSLPAATKSHLSTTLVANKIPESTGAEEMEEEEEEEARFYAFVILHAPEDADMAESMKEKLEKVIGSEGATFSDDFATPGKSTLRCVEDAINNTAFTFLLLTPNFNSRMLDMETNSALINSLNRKHKYNTVIPLLPRENCIPRRSIPLVLQTIVPLEENKNFERKVLKSLSPAKIRRLEKMWIEEQKVKNQIERQERLKQLKQQQKQLIKECEMTQLMEGEHLRLLMTHKLLLGPNVPEQGGEDGRAWWQQQPNIHIENAKYIMIGNDSQMTVDLSGEADKDGSNSREQEL